MRKTQLAPAEGPPQQAGMSKTKAESRRRLSPDQMDSLKTSKPESERDSGFSDGSSGYLSAVDQMDAEDSGRTAVAAAQGTQARPQVAVMTGSFPSLSPMIIMNNVVLKQPNAPTTTLKPWGFQPTLEMLPQPQVVFLQPVVSNNSSTSRKTTADKRRRSRKYLPILKSYPKIAPHPGESSSEKSGSSSSEQNSTASSHGGQHHCRHRQGNLPGRLVSTPDPIVSTLPITLNSRPVSPGHRGNLPASTTTDIRCTTKLAQAADTQEPAPSQTTEAGVLTPWAWQTTQADGNADNEGESNHGSLSDSHSKRQRFCNTYNILNKSGLLGITLRTKELIRQNRRTQGQLERLREQTSLFVEAVRSGDPQVWTKLQLTMMETSPSGTEEDQERREKDGEKDAQVALA